MEDMILLYFSFQFGVVFGKMFAPVVKVCAFCWNDGHSVRVVENMQQLWIVPDVFEAIDALEAVDSLSHAFFVCPTTRNTNSTTLK